MKNIAKAQTLKEDTYGMDVATTDQSGAVMGASNVWMVVWKLGSGAFDKNGTQVTKFSKKYKLGNQLERKWPKYVC